MRSAARVGIAWAGAWIVVLACTRGAPRPAPLPAPKVEEPSTRMSDPSRSASGSGPAIPLPRSSLGGPLDCGPFGLETVLARRRSVRSFAAAELTQAEIGQLAWAAQGITDPATGFRTAPSAGALFPLELLLVASQGVFRYEPGAHALRPVRSGDLRAALSKAALQQQAIAEAPLTMVVTAVVSRTRVKYGDRAERYVYIESGHAAQNVLLAATALGLGAVPIGAMDDVAVQALLELPPGQEPTYLVAIGRPRL